MTWQRVAALGLLVGGAVTAAAFHYDVIAVAAAGFAVNRDIDRSAASPGVISSQRRS